MRSHRKFKKPKKQHFPWGSVMGLLAVNLVGFQASVFADSGLGLIGGQDGSGYAYAAFVSSSGALSPIPGLPASDNQIQAVALNANGLGVIGGIQYVAYVTSNSVFSIPDVSSIYTTCVAINDSGTVLIGGYNEIVNAAIILPTGDVIPLSEVTDSTAFVSSVSLNNSGVGLIGGEGTGAILPYGAYVNTTTQVVTSLGLDSLYSTTSSSTVYVAINEQGNGIIGGYSLAAAPYGYAAFVTPTPTVTNLTLPFDATSGGYIYSVAINASGSGLIGGQDNSGNAYAGFAAAGGNSVTNVLTGPSQFAGWINSVAINDSGTGLIGGYEGSNLYAAFVSGTSVNAFLPGTSPGSIEWVAINDAGVGLIGGNNNSEHAYAALIAPNGTLNVLDVSSLIGINSTALENLSATPASTGPYLSQFNSQLSAGYALDSIFLQHNSLWDQTDTTQIAMRDEDNLTASLDFMAKPKPVEQKKKNTIWVAPFGNYVNIGAQGNTPSYSNAIGGILLAYDHKEDNYLVGAAFGYAFNYAEYSNSLGHAKINEEMLNIYGSYFKDHFRVNGALWGGLTQFSGSRNTLTQFSSNGNTHGWVLTPHLELATPWALDQQKRNFVEPFAMFDWVNSWMNHYTESGASGLNLNVGNFYGSLLQSEVGLRFYEQLMYGWGKLRLEQKLSYINQAPFNMNNATTSFVGSASTFGIAVGSNKIENLAALQFFATFIPRNTAYPYGGFTVEVMGNNNYQSYFGSLYCGIDF